MKRRTAGVTVRAVLPSLRTVTFVVCEPLGAPVVWIFDGEINKLWPLRLALEPLIERASATARAAFTCPAPCSSAGASRLVAVLVMMCLTSSGEGVAPLWVDR